MISDELTVLRYVKVLILSGLFNFEVFGFCFNDLWFRSSLNLYTATYLFIFGIFRSFVWFAGFLNSNWLDSFT